MLHVKLSSSQDVIRYVPQCIFFTPFTKNQIENLTPTRYPIKKQPGNGL